MSPVGSWGEDANDSSREQLSNLYSLFVLSMMLFDGRESEDVLRLAATSVPSLCRCAVQTSYLWADGTFVRCPAEQDADPALDGHVSTLHGGGGRVSLDDGDWRWAFVLRGLGGPTGCLVVHAAAEPTADDFFLLKVLAQQTAAALANAQLLQRERRQGMELRRVVGEREAANNELSATVSRLRQQTTVHEVLTNVSASGEGEPGIADALYKLTSLPVAIEDRFGNLRAWAGPGRPDPYPKPNARRRDELLQRAATLGKPVRTKDKLTALVRPRSEILGVVSLIDPENRIGKQEMFALEYGTTVLALELAHQRSLAEVEVRLHRDLVDDLITGTEDSSAFARADAMGHDLRGPHHVVVVQWSDNHSEDALTAAVSRAAAQIHITALIARRTGMLILLAHGRPDGDLLFRTLAAELGNDQGAIGIGGRSDTPSTLPRSHSEALRALEIRLKSRLPHGATAFDQLGVYRIFDTRESRNEVESFVREWLGPLLDYDDRRNSELVQTLSQYLECGGNYDETAATLVIHRSTLRYRLGRIREITDLDLNNVDTRLNLHVATRAWQVLQGSG
jgi:sugar diacid utilization regulator